MGANRSPGNSGLKSGAQPAIPLRGWAPLQGQPDVVVRAAVKPVPSHQSDSRHGERCRTTSRRGGVLVRTRLSDSAHPVIVMLPAGSIPPAKPVRQSGQCPPAVILRKRGAGEAPARSAAERISCPADPPPTASGQESTPGRNDALRQAQGRLSTPLSMTTRG